MYTKTNMIKTLETAKEYLKSGFIQGEWICKKTDANGLETDGYDCCAEGAVLLACGFRTPGTRRSSFSVKESTRGKYALAVINKLDETVRSRSRRFGSIVEVNDSTGLKTALGWFDKTIQELKESR